MWLYEANGEDSRLGLGQNGAGVVALLAWRFR